MLMNFQTNRMTCQVMDKTIFCTQKIVQNTKCHHIKAWEIIFWKNLDWDCISYSKISEFNYVFPTLCWIRIIRWYEKLTRNYQTWLLECFKISHWQLTMKHKDYGYGFMFERLGLWIQIFLFLAKNLVLISWINWTF